ncbi:MAG: hypothetical protein JWO39_741, partial [Gemmatimonadetes bacterium]|nr:hypothetical protein [Gemmatimonadota bacterium]
VRREESTMAAGAGAAGATTVAPCALSRNAHEPQMSAAAPIESVRRTNE